MSRNQPAGAGGRSGAIRDEDRKASPPRRSPDDADGLRWLRRLRGWLYLREGTSKQRRNSALGRRAPSAERCRSPPGRIIAELSLRFSPLGRRRTRQGHCAEHSDHGRAVRANDYDSRSSVLDLNLERARGCVAHFWTNAARTHCTFEPSGRHTYAAASKPCWTSRPIFLEDSGAAVGRAAGPPSLVGTRPSTSGGIVAANWRTASRRRTSIR